MPPSPDAVETVAYLTGEYPRATDTFIQREVAALRALGIDVRTCSIRTTDASHMVGPEQIAAREATFYVLQAARRPLRLARAHARALRRAPGRWFGALALAWRATPPGLRGKLWQIFYFLEAAVLAEHLRAIGARRLHNHFSDSSCSVAMLTAAMTGLPFSFTLHGPGELFEAGRWRLDEKIARAAFVVCISWFARSQAMLFADPAHWPKLRIAHCGVDPTLYDAAAPAVAEDAGLRLLFVGRIAAVKGAPVLLEAFAALRARRPDATLTLVGDGPERARVAAAAAQAGLKDAVIFTGYLDQAGVAARLREADIFVLPSFAEGVPVVLMEAMAARLPVVASRVAGVPELVEHGVSGLLTAPGDAAGLAEALAALAGDPARRRAMGDAGRARVIDAFDARIEAARVAALLRGTDGGALRPAPAMAPS